MNAFEEEIARLNEECNGQIAPINERMGQLEAKNAEMNQLRRINNEEMKVLADQKAAINEEYHQKKQKLCEESKDYYSVNMSANKLRFLLKGFLSVNDGIRELWDAYVTANFHAASELANDLSIMKGGAA